MILNNKTILYNRCRIMNIKMWIILAPFYNLMSLKHHFDVSTFKGDYKRH